MEGIEDKKIMDKEEILPIEKREISFQTLGEAEDYWNWKENVPRVIRQVVEGSMLGTETDLAIDLPKTKEYLEILKRSIIGNSFPADFVGSNLIKNLLAPLERVKTAGGFLNLFETLANPDISWSLKRTLYETQIKSSFDWIIQKDLAEAEEKNRKAKEEKGEEQNEKESEDNTQEPPPQSDEVKSSMESDQEKGEGLPKAHYTVSPFYGGYAKSYIFNSFDLNQVKWLPAEKKLIPANKQIPYEPETSRIISGLVTGGTPLVIPLYYNYTVDIESVKTNAPVESATIFQDEKNNYYLLIAKEGIWQYEITIGQKGSEGQIGKREQIMIEGELPQEIDRKIIEFKKAKIPEMRIARELVKFIRDHLTYSNSHEAWQKYSQIPKNFFMEIWSGKEADCHVSNTLAMRVLKEAGISARFVGGHYVKDKNEQGSAIMHAGSGHAWLEVWDSMGQKWLRLDATPKGDPTVDEEEQEKDLADENEEGDYGENDEIMSKEKLDDLMKEMQKKSGKEQEKKKAFDMGETIFADQAECTPEQAREFLRALERVRAIKDEREEVVVDNLIREWKKIVEERKIEKTSYQGPVRMDRGDDLVDPVTAVIDVKSKELNPLGFEKIERKEKMSYEFGGINIYFSFDLSGSMSKADIVSGRSKADVQRDTALLFVDSLMQCAFVYRKEADQSELMPLKIMATLASARGQVKLPLTDKWGPKEQWQFYSSLNKLASGGTPTHETLALIEQAFDNEQILLKKKSIPAHKMPLNYVIEISDGIPDDFEATITMHDKLKAKKAIVRAYVVGGGEIDREEYATVDSFSKLPAMLSEDIIGQFQKLHPVKIKS